MIGALIKEMGMGRGRCLPVSKTVATCSTKNVLASVVPMRAPGDVHTSTELEKQIGMKAALSKAAFHGKHNAPDVSIAHVLCLSCA